MPNLCRHVGYNRKFARKFLLNYGSLAENFVWDFGKKNKKRSAFLFLFNPLTSITKTGTTI
jgi:hypothetical protein